MKRHSIAQSQSGLASMRFPFLLPNTPRCAATLSMRSRLRSFELDLRTSNHLEFNHGQHYVKRSS
jgi:hypothetical protein